MSTDQIILRQYELLAELEKIKQKVEHQADQVTPEALRSFTKTVTNLANEFHENAQQLNELENDHDYFRKSNDFIVMRDEVSATLARIKKRHSDSMPEPLKVAINIQEKRMANCTQAIAKLTKLLSEHAPASVMEFNKNTAISLWKKVADQDEVITQYVTKDYERINYLARDMFGGLRQKYEETMEQVAVYEEKMKEFRNRQNNLPKLQLPVFDGNYTKFPTYVEMFKRLIDDNPSLSYVQKLEYLKTTVVGEPLALIQHLSVSADNYVTAVGILEARYGNKRKIANTHLDRMLKGEHMSPKQILDVSRECVEALKNMSLDTIDTFVV